MMLRWSDGALSDVAAILSYISEDSALGAEALAQQIDRTIASLEAFPFIGHRTDNPEIRALLVRRFPYIIFYRATSATVEILHIRHSARRPWKV